jgi:hypothetical protein
MRIPIKDVFDGVFQVSLRIRRETSAVPNIPENLPANSDPDQYFSRNAEGISTIRHPLLEVWTIF